MAITNIKAVKNRSSLTWFLMNRENPDDTGGIGSFRRLNPGADFIHDMWVPWAESQGDLRSNHRIVITPTAIEPPPGGAFTIFQFSGYVFLTLDGTFASRALVPGASHEGGERTVEITGTTLQNAEARFF